MLKSVYLQQFWCGLGGRHAGVVVEAGNRVSDMSPYLMATIATLSSIPESGDDHETPEQMAEVVHADQEWEIRNIIGKEDVDGVVHYLVEWNPTLEPKYALKNAKAVVNKV